MAHNFNTDRTPESILKARHQVIDEKAMRDLALEFIQREHALLAELVTLQEVHGSLTALNAHYLKLATSRLADRDRAERLLERAEALLLEAVAFEDYAFDHDEEVNGGDLVDWFAQWRIEAKDFFAKVME